MANNKEVLNISKAMSLTSFMRAVHDVEIAPKVIVGTKNMFGLGAEIST